MNKSESESGDISNKALRYEDQGPVSQKFVRTIFAV